MSGRYCVSLAKVAPRCPVCGARRYPRTHPHAGTIIETTCRVEKCSIARTLALAGGRAEILPDDDREQLRRPLWAQASNGIQGGVA